MGANASTAVPLYASGQVLDAARLNLTNAGIPVFSGTATRDAAFGGSGEKVLAEGQFAYLEDTDALQYYDGASFKSVGATYTAYTPTWTNLTIGNGTNNFRYAQVGNLVHYYGQLVFGSTTSTASSATLPLPVTGRLNNYYTNNVSYYDTSTDTQFVGAGFVSTTAILFKLPQVTGSFLYHANVGGSNPFGAAFATGDIFNLNFVYEAA